MRISDWSSDVCSSDLREAERCRHLLLDADQRRPVIVGGPPLPVDERAALWQRRAVGQAAVAAQHPRALGQFGELVDALARIFGDAPAQRRDQVDLEPGGAWCRDSVGQYV